MTLCTVPWGEKTKHRQTKSAFILMERNNLGQNNHISLTDLRAWWINCCTVSADNSTPVRFITALSKLWKVQLVDLCLGTFCLRQYCAFKLSCFTYIASNTGDFSTNYPRYSPQWVKCVTAVSLKKKNNNSADFWQQSRLKLILL